MKSLPKPKKSTSPPAPTRLIVKKEIIRTETPATQNVRRLEDALEGLLDQFFGLMIAGLVIAVIGLCIGHGWILGIGLAAFIGGAYGFFRYLLVWRGDTRDHETVEEQLYVELPPRTR